MSDEACQIVLLSREPGVVDVGAPMKYKQLCYDILKDAAAVIGRTPDLLFREEWTVGARIVITMSMAGVVDVAAPLPNRELCEKMLRLGRVVIERYDEAEAREKNRRTSSKSHGRLPRSGGSLARTTLGRRRSAN